MDPPCGSYLSYQEWILSCTTENRPKEDLIWAITDWKQKMMMNNDDNCYCTIRRCRQIIQIYQKSIEGSTIHNSKNNKIRSSLSSIYYNWRWKIEPETKLIINHHVQYQANHIQYRGPAIRNFSFSLRSIPRKHVGELRFWTMAREPQKGNIHREGRCRI